MRWHVRLTGLLSVGGRIPSFLWHSGQKLRETQGRTEIWHCAAEVEQVLKAVSERDKRQQSHTRFCHHNSGKNTVLDVIRHIWFFELLIMSLYNALKSYLVLCSSHWNKSLHSVSMTESVVLYIKYFLCFLAFDTKWNHGFTLRALKWHQIDWMW